MNVAECLAWVGGTWMAIAIAAAGIKHRLRRRPPLPQRTPEDVYRDADQRAKRIDETNARLNGVPAAPDNREGLRLDWADEAELIWAATNDRRKEGQQ